MELLGCLSVAYGMESLTVSFAQWILQPRESCYSFVNNIFVAFAQLITFIICNPLV